MQQGVQTDETCNIYGVQTDAKCNIHIAKHELVTYLSEETKIVVFQKRPRESVDINLNIVNEQILIVQQYTYLGTRLTSTRNFTLALEHLRKSPAR